MLFLICGDIIKEWNSVKKIWKSHCPLPSVYVKYICELYVYILQKGIIYLPRDFFFLPGELGWGGEGEGCTTDEKKEFTWCNFTFIVLYLFWNTFLGVIGLCVHHVKSWYHLEVHDTWTELTLIIISYGNKISEVSSIIVLFFWSLCQYWCAEVECVGHFNKIGLKTTDISSETKYMKTYTHCIKKAVWKKIKWYELNFNFNVEWIARL